MSTKTMNKTQVCRDLSKKILLKSFLSRNESLSSTNENPKCSSDNTDLIRF